MTLCIVSRFNGQIHFASDSRLKIDSNSYADVAIKVLALPYRIYSATDQDGNKTLDYEGELGMCFAGSAVNSLFIKETITEIIKNLQYAPPLTDVSFDKLVTIIFKAYKVISKAVCETVLAERGISEIFIAGFCPKEKGLRVYKFETNPISNSQSFSEVLRTEGEYILSGNGKNRAEQFLKTLTEPTIMRDLLLALKETIDDTNVEDVGGHIQYGVLGGNAFITHGIVEYLENGEIKYWRGFIDLNGGEFMSASDDLVLSYSYIDPFDTFRQKDNDTDEL